MDGGRRRAWESRAYSVKAALRTECQGLRTPSCCERVSKARGRGAMRRAYLKGETGCGEEEVDVRKVLGYAVHRVEEVLCWRSGSREGGGDLAGDRKSVV